MSQKNYASAIHKGTWVVLVLGTLSRDIKEGEPKCQLVLDYFWMLLESRECYKKRVCRCAYMYPPRISTTSNTFPSK